MSDENPAPTHQELQFDRVIAPADADGLRPEAAAAPCTTCQAAITSEY